MDLIGFLLLPTCPIVFMVEHNLIDLLSVVFFLYLDFFIESIYFFFQISNTHFFELNITF